MPKKPVSKRITEFVKDTPLNYTDLIQLHDDVSTVFFKKWKSGEENERYMKYDHWSKEERKAIEATAGRQAYSFPIIAHKLNTILSAQRNARTSFRVESAQDPNDDIKAELATIDMKDFERYTKFRYIESDVFQGGVGVQYGAIHILTDHDEDYNTVITAENLDYRDVVWDTNSRDYLHDDALFVAKLRRRYRKDMREEYGDIVDNIPYGQDFFTAYSRDVYNYMIQTSKARNMDYDVLTEITHYQKVQRTYYCAMMDAVVTPQGMIDAQVIIKTRKKKEAEESLNSKLFEYLSQGIQVNGGVIEKKEWKYDKYVFSLVGIVEYEETELTYPPIIVYRAFQYQGDWWTMTDILKDPQVFMDRLMSQVDYSLGTDVKNAFEVDITKLAPLNTPEQVAGKLTKTGGIIYKQGVNKVVNKVESGGGQVGQYLELSSVLQQMIEDLAGGRSFSGLKDESGESGKAIALKQAQGQMIAELFIDNLVRWKQRVGEVTLEWKSLFQNYERMVKVGGSSLTQEMIALLRQNNLYEESKVHAGTGFVKIPDQNGESYLKSAKLELLVTEGELTESDRSEKLKQVLAISQITGTPPPVSLVLQYSDMDYSAKQEWQKAADEQKAQQQAIMQQQQQNVEDKRNIEKAKVLQKGIEPHGKGATQ
jgi:hypothetical protein